MRENVWRSETTVCPAVSPVHVALFHPYSAFLDGDATGGAIYEQAALDLLRTIRPQITITHFVPASSQGKELPRSTRHGEPIHFYRATLLERWVSEKPHTFFSLVIVALGLLRTRNQLKDLGINLAYFSSPSHMALRLGNFPFIFTVWDTGHRDLPDFEEMASPKEYATRENLYQNAIPNAFHVMVESEITGKKLEKLYGLQPENWSAIGLLPRVDDVPIIEPSIEGDYIIYPAARWRHKNHETLFRAFKKVLEDDPGLKLVLTGSDAGYGAELANLISEIGIGEAVVDLGLVSRGELLGLIKHSKALVMPTLLGPTNIPPLEALALGTHAIISDVHDYGTEVDDFVTKVPATDPSAWAETILTVLRQESPKPVGFSWDEAIAAHEGVFSSFIEQNRNGR